MATALGEVAPKCVGNRTVALIDVTANQLRGDIDLDRHDTHFLEVRLALARSVDRWLGACRVMGPAQRRSRRLELLLLPATRSRLLHLNE